MGVAVWGQIPRKHIGLDQLAGRRIAFDAFNTIYYFLAMIRHRTTGEPLKDHQGHITSHLSGLLYRTVKFLEVDIKPVYVFDGRSPDFKKQRRLKRGRQGGEAGAEVRTGSRQNRRRYRRERADALGSDGGALDTGAIRR